MDGSREVSFSPMALKELYLLSAKPSTDKDLILTGVRAIQFKHRTRSNRSI